MACAEGYKESNGEGMDMPPQSTMVDAGAIDSSPVPDASAMIDATNNNPTPTSGCDLPYLCAESAEECSDFWEGEVLPNISCDPAEGAVCCNPFTSESGGNDQSDGGMPAEPPSGTPMSRENFCMLIIECVMPEGSTMSDCNSVYDDSYCGNWDHYLTCMNSCASIDCASDEFGTEFVVCEYDCFENYCG